MMRPPNYGKSGFTLIEAVIVVAILGIAGYFLSHLLVTATDQSVRLTVKQERRDLHEEISSIIKADGCGIGKLLNEEFEVVNKVPLPKDFEIDVPTTMVFDLAPGPVPSSPRPDFGLRTPFMILDLGTRVGKHTVTKIELTGYQDLTVNPPVTKYVGVNSEKNLVRAQITVTLIDQTGANRNSSDPTDLSRATYFSRHPVILSIDQKDTPTDSTDDELLTCRSVEEIAYIQETCLAADGEWNTNTLKCNLDNKNKTDNGSGSFCAISESCNVNKNYRWPPANK
ncbi:MAG: hypothetical protein RJB66_1402 [Pseudomonadota bacterium]|jgi:prepilin-type N-terminal cleavage/methylation domain-containing protein